MASIKVELLGDSTSLERAFLRGAKASAQLKVGLGGVVKTAAAIAGVTVGVRALGNVLTSSVQAAGDFQLALQKTVGLSGVAQGAIRGLRNDVLKLGPAVGKGPQELADALFFITSSGIPASRALDVLTVSAKASAAGLGETQVVADAVTSALNAYGPAVLKATQATDVLVATVREGKGEADQFAGVIGNVAAIAAQLGVSFDQVGAALAAQTRLGTDAETAATQLQRVFGTFVKVTPQSAKAFKSVGLDADKLRAELAKPGGLLTVLNQVKTAFGNNLPAEAKAFGDVRALRGVLALVGKQADATRGIFDRLAHSAGSTKDAFGAISKTQAQQFAKLNASIDTFKIALGAALAPSILKVIGPLNKWLSVTKNQERVQRDIRKAVQDSVAVFHDIKDAITPFVQVSRDAIGAVGGLKNAVKILLTVLVVSKIVNFASAITGIGTEAAISAGKVRALRLALLRLSAIGVIVVGVELVINRDKIDKKVNSFLRGHGLGFLTGKQIKISPDIDLAKLTKLRNTVADTVGENDLMVKALDKVIDRISKATESVGNLARTAAEHGRGVLDGIGPTTGGGQHVVDAVNTSASATVKAAKLHLDKLFNSFDVALTRAQLTDNTKDDLAVLRSQLSVVSSLLAKHKNNLQLQQKQADLLGQINQLEKQRVDQLASLALARAGLTIGKSDDLRVLRSQLDVTNQQLKTDKDNLDLQQKQVDLQGQILDIQRAAREQQKSLFGSLFARPDTSQFPTFLGGTRGRRTVPGTGNTPQDLLKTISAQNKNFAALTTNIATLIGKGAPASLITAARSGEISAEQVQSLANASPKVLQRIFAQIRRADRLVAQAAKAEINAKTVALRAGTVNFNGALRSSFEHGKGDSGDLVVHTTVTLDGKKVGQSLERHSKKRTQQTRGRTGGKR